MHKDPHIHIYHINPFRISIYLTLVLVMQKDSYDVIHSFNMYCQG